MFEREKRATSAEVGNEYASRNLLRKLVSRHAIRPGGERRRNRQARRPTCDLEDLSGQRYFADELTQVARAK